MGITRKFVGWDGPILPRVVEWLRVEYGDGSRLDLSGVCVVVPGARAGRCLLELLVAEAERIGLAFLPPRIRTVGDLPEFLYQPRQPFADRLTQQLAWTRAIRDSDPSRLRRFVAQVPDDSSAGHGTVDVDVDDWLRLGQMLWRQHRDLAADGLNFQHVVDFGRQAATFQETERWQFLRDLQLTYWAQLDRCHLWDRQTARLHALENRECHVDFDIVLVAMVDMSQVVRQMLDQVADRIVSLIAAPAEWEPRFDEFGCLVPAAWADMSVDLRDEQIQVADGPEAQSNVVVETLVAYGGRYRADEITVGLPDPLLSPWIEHVLESRGLVVQRTAGQAIQQTGLFRLVQAIAEYLVQESYQAFAALVRHPRIVEWLDRQWSSLPVSETDSMSVSALHPELDRFQNDRLPIRMDLNAVSAKRYPLVRWTLDALQQVLDPLRTVGSEVRLQPLPVWGESIAGVVYQFYRDVMVTSDEMTLHPDVTALRRFQDALAELGGIPTELSPQVSGTQAVNWFMQLMENHHGYVEEQSDAVTMTGWLELPLDTSPALVVTSFNEEFLPESLNSDVFLPNRIRQELGLVDNARRYARDAYALSVLVHSREDLTVIVPRRDTEGNPLKPSRLMFATDDDGMLRRALQVFRDRDNDGLGKATVLFDHGVESIVEPAFSVPRPEPLDEPVTTMTVTSFRDYLACPYRFYLSHVAKLEVTDDRSCELDARFFGNIIHEVVSRFGKHSIRDSDDEDAVREFLREELKRCAREWLGGERLPAVNLQISQIAKRLDALASWQVGWVRLGWRIRHTEVPDDEGTVAWKTDQGTMQIRGRIDRIDYHEATKRWMVFDYKTSDHVKSPEKTHRAEQGWIDLQLPLYRHIVKLLGIHEPVSLGYILLPKETEKTKEYCAKWTDSDLEVADDRIGEVIEAVLAERFWPPTTPAPRVLREFASLCNEGVLS